jgi:uracil-DNA glycosylase family 4
VADAKDVLRRYLEQRIELGEQSIVLETMTASDVMAARPVERAVREPAGAGPGAPVRIADWRSALQQPNKAPAAAPVEPTAPLSALDSLAAIAASVASCTRCPLYATATNPVPGEGNPDADFMIVGEAPGATEDETGRPFVGKAGQLLTQIIAAIQLKREDVFICNVLKHRPPGNRNPAPEEVTACSPFLIRQIELIRPKVILALGTFSAQTLLNTKTSIGKLRGQVHEYHGVPVVVTYHPAALLRNPAWKRPTWEDVQLARRILDSAVPGA